MLTKTAIRAVLTIARAMFTIILSVLITINTILATNLAQIVFLIICAVLT
jgi:hypothetical protein